MLDDFRLARQHIAMMLHLKLGSWQSLPYIFLGIGHPCETVARELAAAGLKQFQESSPLHREELADSQLQATAIHHPLTLDLCSHDRPLRGCLEAFIAGTSLQDLPLLLQFAGKARFTPITERWVESLHASTHRSLQAAPNAGPLHIAFEAMLPRLKQSLQVDPSSFSAYATHCSQTRNIRLALEAAGLQHHPTMLAATQELSWRSFHKKAYPWAVLVHMHADEASMHPCIPADAVERPGPTRGLQTLNMPEPEATSDVADAIWATAAFDELKSKHLHPQVAERQG